MAGLSSYRAGGGWEVQVRISFPAWKEPAAPVEGLDLVTGIEFPWDTGAWQPVLRSQAHGKSGKVKGCSAGDRDDSIAGATGMLDSRPVFPGDSVYWSELLAGAQSPPYTVCVFERE